MNYLDKIIEGLWSFLPKLLGFILTVYLGFILVNWLIRFLEKRLKSKKINHTALGFFMSILGFALKVLVVAVGLGILNVPMASISAVIGASTLSIGLALQGSLANFAGGMVLVTTEPFKVGDFIWAEDHEGTVEDIAILTTQLRTVDGKRVVIPNSLLSSSSLVNYSAYDYRRMDIELDIVYEADIDQVKKTLMEAVEKIDGAKDPQVILRSYGDQGYDFILRVWFPRASLFTDTFALNELIKPALDQAGIELAYPHLDLALVGGMDGKEEIYK